jgi:polyvinyl alcohol dehydrogenase (cytochrome)
MKISAWMVGISWLLVGLFGMTAATVGAAQPAAAQPVNGEALFASRCKSCHDPAVGRAPGKLELLVTARREIFNAVANGVMSPMAQGLSKEEIEAIAAYLTPLQNYAGGVDPMCARVSGSDWQSPGKDTGFSHYQNNPGLRAKDVSRLKVKWAFAMPGGGRPVVVGNWLFITNSDGKFYALNAKTGCVHWVVDDAPSRSTPSVIRSTLASSGWLTVIGVGRRVRAFDAGTGKEMWRTDVLDDVGGAYITGSPVVSGEQVFVPISSHEELLAIQPGYACCKFRGSLVALDLRTGRKQWQTFMISDPPHPTRVNAEGVQMQGPAGAAIWAAPTVDAKRGLVYVVTGNSYTDVASEGTDAVVAVEAKTGAVRWRRQVTTDDDSIIGCVGPQHVANCPVKAGPDLDFGASALLFEHAGKQILIAAQKSGVVYGIAPDTGEVLWKTRVSEGSSAGGTEWGIAADRDSIFVPVSDLGQLSAAENGFPSPPGKPGLFSLAPFTGKVLWNVPAPVATCHYADKRSQGLSKVVLNSVNDKPCMRAQSAAPGVMPGVVFSGTLDGWFRAYDAASGKILWALSTLEQDYDTVNGIHGQPGGGIDGMGPAIADGMVYVMSGYNGVSTAGGKGMNVLLALSVNGE